MHASNGRDSTSGKHHVMLCDKHVMCGTCPYEGRCKYIHDEDLSYKIGDFLTRQCKCENNNSTKDNSNKDSFYWPHYLVSGNFAGALN